MKAFGLFLQLHPWITLINLGLRADRSATGKGWGFGTASRAGDQLGTQLELGKIQQEETLGEARPDSANVLVSCPA